MSSTPEYNHEYYLKNRTRVLARNKKWNAEHKEVMAKIERNWNIKNPGKKKKRIALWAKEHPEETKAKYNRRRARLLGNGGSFSGEEWMELCKKHNHKCVCCNKCRKLEADHVIPLIFGGTNNIENIQPLCRSCNATKGSKSTDYRRLMHGKYKSGTKRWARA